MLAEFWQPNFAEAQALAPSIHMMFETAELGQSVSKEEFKKRELRLWENLLKVQRDLKDYNRFNVMIDFAGVHGAGKLSAINMLSKWMDVRRITTHAYGAPTEEERQRPEFWRFWRDLPPRGEIGLYLSGRYSRPLIDYVYGETKESEFREQLDRINDFERMLAEDGTLILKFWMHLSRKAQKKRLKALEKDPLQSWQVTETDWKHWELYDKFIEAAEILISTTNTGHAPWHIVEGEDFQYRSLRVGKIVRKAIAKQLEASQLETQFQQENHNSNSVAEMSESGEYRTVTILDSISTSKSIGRGNYRDAMDEQIARLNLLHRKALDQKLSTILVFEGPDASGKGGIIRRLSRALDAVNYRVTAYGAPTAEESRYHYLWRFWKYIPSAGRMMLFDRSWYGRVLVERVEDLATEAEWQRAYGEINNFEAQLTDQGILLLKFWLHITKDEQLKRFDARKVTPHKRWKLTDEDWRNRNQWEAYEQAVHDMIQRTSTASAPWHIIEGNSKLYGRVKIMKTVCKSLEAALEK